MNIHRFPVAFCMALLAILLLSLGCSQPAESPKSEIAQKLSDKLSTTDSTDAEESPAITQQETTSPKKSTEYSNDMAENRGKRSRAPAGLGEGMHSPVLSSPSKGTAGGSRILLRKFPVRPDFNTESYDRIIGNAFRNTLDHPLSTFSADVDTASYANMRRFLTRGALPPKDSVRIEELINYFPYRYPPPENGEPFSIHTEVARAFWNPEHHLVRIAIKGKEIEWKERPASNLVFLLDVSGSMQSPNKLPLLKRSLKLVVDRLGERDRVAIAVYAGAAGLVLPSTPGDHKTEIMASIDRLRAGGSTNGGAGIQLAYRIASENLIPGGINRVILATDGDFNVGITNQGDLTRLIEQKAKSGVFLTVLGYGMGNYKDSRLEKLADLGNGNYAYIDSLNEARKVLVEQIGGTLITIAKDVKFQVEFNPRHIASYRLIGYENRLLNKEDFNDDSKDAGDVGAGHTVTAFYEVVPAAAEEQGAGSDPLKYQQSPALSDAAQSGEWMTIKIRYKDPEGSASKLITRTLRPTPVEFASASDDFQFAASVASFGMLLRDSEFKGESTLERVLEIVDRPVHHREPYRREFAGMVRQLLSIQDQLAKRG